MIGTTPGRKTLSTGVQMLSFFDALFGCAHRHYTFPITAKKAGTLTPEGRHSKATYIVCLDCGKEFPYDWQEMKLIAPEKDAA